MQFDQIAILVTGCISIWLANDNRKSYRIWASIIGMIGQPFWFYASYRADQWGIMCLSIFYAIAWAKGLYLNTRKEILTVNRSKECSHCGDCVIGLGLTCEDPNESKS